MYVLAFLDRVNIGFAKQAFQASTGLSNGAYAFGAGLFFVTYALLEIPSNLILHKVGARLWMARIMVSWGLTSAAMMFARGAASFYLLRALLGAAEAGFFPGVILYLSYWFPSKSLGRVLGIFYFGAPLAFIVGGPLSGLLMDLHGKAGLEGWQWIFLVEGLLACGMGFWAYFYLGDRPASAAWLPEGERHALTSALFSEERSKPAHRLMNLRGNLPLIHYTAIYFLIQMSVYGVVFYLPTQVAALLGTRIGVRVGLVAAVPWVCALVATYFMPRIAHRTGSYRGLAAMLLAISASGIAVSATGRPLVALIALCFAAAAFNAVQPLFWTFPMAYLGGTAAAGGFALVNAVGALGGFVAPNVKNWAEIRFASPRAALFVLAATTMLGALLVLLLTRSKQPGQRPLDPVTGSNDATEYR